MPAHVYIGYSTKVQVIALKWKLENNFQGSVLSEYHLDSKDLTQVVRLHRKYLYFRNS